MEDALPHPAVWPTAWRGEELFARDDWEIVLPGNEPPSLPTLMPLLAGIREALEHGSGALRIRGLGVEDWDAATCEQAFRRIATGLGTPVSQSARGELVFHVRDEEFAPDDPRFRGPSSARRLGFHTDRCDVIAFLCLNQAGEGGDSYVVSSMALYEELAARRPDLLAVLREPYLYLRHVVDTGNQLPTCLQPIFSEYEGHFAASLLRVLIDRADRAPELPDLTTVQREALDYLDELAGDPALHARFRLERGDVLLLNNWVTFHRRDAFVNTTGDPRHLLRAWLSMPGSRPLDPRFRDNFGATEAGAIRGGMTPLRAPG